MGEKLPAGKETIEYEGPFNAKELVRYLQKWFDSKGYGWKEDKHVESVSEKGRSITLSIAGENEITDYAKKAIKVKVSFSNMTDKVVEHQGNKKRIQIGKVKLGVESVLETDYGKRWKEDKPAFYLLRLFYEKYIYSPYSKELKGDAKNDLAELKESLRSYLNLFRYAP